MCALGTWLGGCEPELLFLDENNQPTTGPVWFSLSHTHTLRHTCTHTWITCHQLQGSKWEGRGVSWPTHIHKPFKRKCSVDITEASVRSKTQQGRKNLLILLISLSVLKKLAGQCLRFIPGYPDTSPLKSFLGDLWDAFIYFSHLWVSLWSWYLSWKAFMNLW